MLLTAVKLFELILICFVLEYEDAVIALGRLRQEDQEFQASLSNVERYYPRKEREN